MITKKEWSEFRNTGLLLYINQILHIFGWSIVFNFNEDGSLTEVFPARVKFRGFDNESVTEEYRKITEYINNESENLLKDLDS